MIRPAGVADLDAIMRVERASFPTDAWSEVAMRAELASPHSRYVALDLGGRLAGYAGLRAVAGSRDGDVQTIAVDQAFRGRGGGRMLLRALLEAAHELEVREVFLDVRADNPVAQRLYASEGFVEVGRRPRYYQPDDVDALVMRIELAGWAAERVDVSALTTQADTRPDGAGTGGGAGLPALRAAEGAVIPTGDAANAPAKGWC